MLVKGNSPLVTSSGDVMHSLVTIVNVLHCICNLLGEKTSSILCTQQNSNYVRPSMCSLAKPIISQGMCMSNSTSCTLNRNNFSLSIQPL